MRLSSLKEEFGYNSTLEGGSYETARGAGFDAHIDGVGASGLAHAGMDFVAGLTVDKKPDPEHDLPAGKPKIEQTGQKLVQKVNEFKGERAPEMTKTGVAFTAAGHGARASAENIQRQEKLVHDMQALAKELKDAKPSLDPETKKPAQDDSPTIQIVQSGNDAFSGQGSDVTVHQSIASDFGFEDGGYGYQQSAPEPHAHVDLLCEIEEIVEPGMQGITTMKLDAEMMAAIDEQIGQWDSDIQLAKESFEHWQQNALQVTDFNDVKEQRNLTQDYVQQVALETGDEALKGFKPMGVNNAFQMNSMI